MNRRVIKGTKDLRDQEKSGNVQVLKGSIDPRQLRCQKCDGLAVATPNGKGGSVSQCSQCGARYSSSSF
jgi:hypothetical protein